MPLRSALVAPLAGFLALAPFASAQSFTLQQVLRAPFSSNLTAAPQGHSFAWVSNAEGRRNLWVSVDDQARQLTHDTADDGIDLGNLTWTPDGASVVYVRGGDFEFPEKPSPNPARLKDGIEQQIWIAPVHGGEPRLLTSGQAPQVSPDGKTLAYLLKDQVWTLDLTQTGAKPAQLFVGRGKEDDLQWAPDGHALAFVSRRGDHSFIGVFTLSVGQVSYLDPGTEEDSNPAWSPNSRQVAFLRVPPEVGNSYFRAHRTDVPWSICVADAETGQGRELWRAQEGQGSVFHDVATDRQLYWTASNHLVFPWERTGWLHLYAVPVTGGEATELTPGSFEVEHVALGSDHDSLVYSSNQGDIDRRHVWQVAAAGGTPKPITTGQGIEVFPAVSGDGAIAVLRSDARLPMRPATIDGDGLHDLAPQLIPADFPAAQLVVPEPVMLTAADGLELHGQIFLPAAAHDGKRHPALIFFHGGSRRQMLLGWHCMDYYSNAYAMNQYLASLGYIVLSVNYRSGIGYGLNFREALHYGASGASEFNDVLGAGLYLRGRADVDPARIGVWGGSYGGYLTALALSRASDLFAAGVDFHGVHDWNLELENWQEPTYDPNADANAVRVGWESSPLATVKDWRSPVLLIQGDDDRNVQFSQTVRLAAALRAQHTPFEELVFPDEIHGFLLYRDWLAAYTAEAKFFARYFHPQP
ncbi:prolyl oligopeptidase family serine peptidase [Silvibacterium dinghuense]|uniref:Acyl-peptide hydrolase n=1 Tax=Silvibacterium dinghuense TaxID=1560006 RepID=A0A4Q1SHK4_9BACT|nr:prolyl oligopeptidase family serine peptidase [Silvibacterium dinghuense]RXS97044.1 S9 family peptidase [Silvibacterium dinghuense]GGG95711.1 hypothetical protein GCM10011586_08500 [Silvibacterium dinghuense]